MFDINDILLDRFEIFGYRKGGMGIVYFVTELVTGRHFAAKTYQPGILEEEEIINRFYNELDFSIQLKEHENLLTVYFIKEIERQKYLFTDYIDGGDKGSTLDERIAGEEIDFQAAISLAYQIAKGMEFLNSRGSVAHMDLKPSNILVTSNDTVKISDYGLARNTDPFAHRLTTESMRSWPYMSPEQFRGEFVDTRSDIYSFGILFYQMLTGNYPFKFDFEGKTEEQILNFFKEFHTSQNLGKEFYREGLTGESGLDILKRSIGNIGDPTYKHSDDLGIILSGCIHREREKRFYKFTYIIDAFEFAFSRYLIKKRLHGQNENRDNFQRGLDFKELEKHSQALQFFNKALKKQSENEMIWFEASFSLWKTGLHKDAIRFLEKAISLDPDNIEIRKRLTSYQKQLKGGV